MANDFQVNAASRNEHGKAHARRMRRKEGRIPAVVYGAGKSPQSLSIDHDHILHLLEDEVVFSHILDLSIDDKKEKVVIKDVLRHPHKPKVMHVDFQRINIKESITMHVPLHFQGEDEAPGLKSQGGVLSKLMTDLEIKCLPTHLPEHIDIDLSALSVGDTIHLSDIKLPKGVELAVAIQDDAHDHAVASIHAAKSASVDDASAGEGTEEDSTDSE